MKRFLLGLILLPQLVFAQYSAKCFKLETDKEQKETAVNKRFSNDSVLTLDIKGTVSGFSISGSTTLNGDNDSYVRVILTDVYNYDYLVYENYPVLSDGQTTKFTDTAIESKLMDGIVPKSLRIEVLNAVFELESYSFSTLTNRFSVSKNREIQKEQSEHIVDQLNKNLRKHKLTWRAGITSMSEKTYEEKKAMFGGKLPELYGFEYYAGGIFVMPDTDIPKAQPMKAANSASSSQYVSEWDWRNRHGKNWMTPVKDQGDCGSCWAFAAIGTLEPYINLYYNNDTIDYELSEQELVSCSMEDGCEGGNSGSALNYIENNGIVNEYCFGYTATDNDCYNKCQVPSEKVYIESYHYYYKTNEDSIKKKLFREPVVFGIEPWWHIIVLAGYKIVEAGDTLYIRTISQNEWVTVPENSPLIGKTAWLLKNSWGDSWGESGYAYVITNTNDIYMNYYIDGKITCHNYTDNDIICEDADGDGYYFWGIGEKPTNCPSWVPDTPDGDDSNINYGALDEYGNLEQLPAGITIKTMITYVGNYTLTHRIGIVNGGTLRITGTRTLAGNAKIRVCEGGTLIVDGGSLLNANLELIPGSQVIVRNNGRINMATGVSFDAPQGVVVNVENGNIQ